MQERKNHDQNSRKKERSIPAAKEERSTHENCENLQFYGADTQSGDEIVGEREVDGAEISNASVVARTVVVPVVTIGTEEVTPF